jgi:quercetin dioxygenase-like cupin family protein
MYKINVDNIPEKGINRKYRDQITIRYLLVQEFGTPNFEMRYFELNSGSLTALDQHPYEHEIFIVRGRGKLLVDSREYILRQGDAILIQPNEVHQLRQVGEEPLGFICVVPNGVSRSKQQVDLDYPHES